MTQEELFRLREKEAQSMFLSWHNYFIAPIGIPPQRYCVQSVDILVVEDPFKYKCYLYSSLN